MSYTNRRSLYFPLYFTRVCVCVSVWTDWWHGRLDSVQSEARQRDVYLGGSCGHSSWRDDVAIPVLLYVFTHLVHH